MIKFIPWAKFRAFEDKRKLRVYLRSVGSEAAEYFKDQLHEPKTGILYRRKGGYHRASAPGEFPANDSGALKESIGFETTEDTVTIGSGKFYSVYLRNGTSIMRRRKMSDFALTETSDRSRPLLEGLVAWRK